jgi:DnaJ family protein A protein 2
MSKETKLYDLLDVSPSATCEEIKKAFRKKSLTHHPDKGGDVEVYKQINSAYEILSDQNKRKLYDDGGENALRNTGDISQDTLSQMFGNMFGGGGFPFGGQGFFSRGNTPARSSPIVHTYKVSLEDLSKRKVTKLKITRDRMCPNIDDSQVEQCINCQGKGIKVHIRQLGPGMIQQIQQPCDRCHSTGKIFPTCDNCKEGVVKDPKIFELHLTPELENGYRFVFQQEGNQELGKQPGDVIVVLQYEEHPVFKLEDKNLVYTHTISLKEALCGYNFKISHPSGEIISVATSGITTIETVETIPHKGLSYQGSMIIRYRIVFPTKLSQDQSDILASVL